MTEGSLKRLENLLGLARRGGKIKASEPEIKAAILYGQAAILLLASDATERATRNFKAAAEQNDVKIAVVEGLSRERLGFAVGKSARSAVAIIDHGFKRAIEKILQANDDE